MPAPALSEMDVVPAKVFLLSCRVVSQVMEKVRPGLRERSRPFLEAASASAIQSRRNPLSSSCEVLMNSVRAKVERAREHFSQVQGEIDTWISGNAYTAIYERNEAGDQHYLRAKLNGAPPPIERWALLFGDGMTNLRDSLDHLIYQISNSNIESPSHPKAAFVLVRDPSSFKGEARNKLANVSQTVHDTIESFQPWNRQHPLVTPSLLSVLSSFAITNKHKLLLPVFTMPSSFRFTVATQTPSGGRVATTRNSIEDGSVFFIYETNKPEPGTTLAFEKIVLDIGLPHESPTSVPEILSGRSPARFLLPALLKEVEDVIGAVSPSL